LTILSVPGIASSRRPATSRIVPTASSVPWRWTPAKKAAKLQNSSRFHLANGWLWHCAHSRRMPRNAA